MSSDLPISSPYRSSPGEVVSESERNQLNVRLNAAYTAGSLDPEDYQSRLDQLFAARTLGELVPVVTGLPPLRTYDDPAMVVSSGGQPGQLAPSRDAQRLTLLVVAGVAVAVVLLGLLLLLLL
ncbi:DUF1707 domain-containing protein [uncultured Friedmanniella sp.]|uniref:DUF1707 SHOCT-like domain-containing protein n=1 Tax=uncultured Friedmanniella sp. TaxID=335381 RepID=UPI0035CA655C